MAERRYTVLLYAAVLTAVVATFGVYRVLQNTKAKSQVATRPVVVASKDLPEGASLSGSNVETKQFPVATIPTDAYSKPDSLENRVTRVAVFKGEVIVPGRLAPSGTGPGLEVKIGGGKRAMAVRINDVAGISGLIQPNSHVDVVVTMRPSGEQTTGPQMSKVFMQDMRVLSMGTTVERDANGKPITATTAALEVTPEQAEILAVATHEGSIQLVLRGYGDKDTVKTKGALTRDVITSSGGEVVSTSTPVRAAVSERRARPSRPVVKPEPVAPAPVIVAPPPPAPKPESLNVTIFRAGKPDQRKFPMDSMNRPPAVRPDTTA